MIFLEDKQFKQLLGSIKDIEGKLSILISLQKSSTKPPKLGTEEKSVLKLCNGKNSIDEISKTVNKKKNNVKVTLTHLKKKGLIRSSKFNKKIVYVKI